MSTITSIINSILNFSRSSKTYTENERKIIKSITSLTEQVQTNSNSIESIVSYEPITKRWRGKVYVYRRNGLLTIGITSTNVGDSNYITISPSVTDNAITFTLVTGGRTMDFGSATIICTGKFSSSIVVSEKGTSKDLNIGIIQGTYISSNTTLQVKTIKSLVDGDSIELNVDIEIKFVPIGTPIYQASIQSAETNTDGDQIIVTMDRAVGRADKYSIPYFSLSPEIDIIDILPHETDYTKFILYLDTPYANIDVISMGYVYDEDTLDPIVSYQGVPIPSTSHLSVTNNVPA